mmetsp:Transcript_15161/g.21079  ORF Transcript_15161/g.21079 Transcript_15161/m.21079 type:complete len:107 (-) Transcript_15161:125-445(-)|eukprot:CAMPEP_0185254990 /NCGR_PEP_ID=MMETSP1359-20130426/3953_1 /TAXON_ID=552665 /ORGANISM="Bigelowiella longifila, Strain CCMP242" /LENGTH=106 /DNA_ID=CAMNT_0027838525 /DNA_START=62 /DNA_END=382 /DNA_ORIENTATION=-
MERNYRFYAAQAAATGLLISAVKFPLNTGSFTSVVSQLELASVVMLMNHVPGAGLVGSIAAALGVKATVDEVDTSVSRTNKLVMLGGAGVLCLGLFMDKRGIKIFG